MGRSNLSASKRSMPHDPQAEEAILGSILLENGAFVAAVGAGLTGDDFFGDGSLSIWEAMLALYQRDEPIDNITLRAELDRRGDLERVGGQARISSLIDGLPAVANVADYVRIVKNHAVCRHLARVCFETGTKALEGGQDPAGLGARLRGHLDAIAVVGDWRSDLEICSLASILEDPEALCGPSVVVPRLAWAGRVTLLAAREKEGKSTLVSGAASAVTNGAFWLDAVAPRGKVMWICVEEHKNDLGKRLEEFGADPQIDVVSVKHGARDPLAAIHSAVAERRPALVIIDTLSTLVAHCADSPDPGNSAAWVAIMSALTRIARDTNAALILIHHARKSDGKYRDSSAIGAGVDAIIEMSVKSGDGNARNLQVRARWRVDDYSIRLVDHRYELISGPLEARVLQHVSRHPGCSMRALREAVGGRTAAIGEAVEQLIDNEDLENRGDKKSMRLHAVGGSQPRNHPHEEVVPDSGSALVPRASQPEPGVVPPRQPLWVGRGTAPAPDSDVIEL